VIGNTAAKLKRRRVERDRGETGNIGRTNSGWENNKEEDLRLDWARFLRIVYPTRISPVARISEV
jgi:hypothetical protein